MVLCCHTFKQENHEKKLIISNSEQAYAALRVMNLRM